MPRLDARHHDALLPRRRSILPRPVDHATLSSPFLSPSDAAFSPLPRDRPRHKRGRHITAPYCVYVIGSDCGVHAATKRRKKYAAPTTTVARLLPFFAPTPYRAGKKPHASHAPPDRATILGVVRVDNHSVATHPSCFLFRVRARRYLVLGRDSLFFFLRLVVSAVHPLGVWSP